MRIIRPGPPAHGSVLAENFSGPGGVVEQLLRGTDSGPFSVGIVHLEAASHSDWHSHSGGQVLQITSGIGYIQVRGETIHRLEPGDVVLAAADEVHWHGAGPDEPVEHLAVSLGDHVWYEAAVDPSFASEGAS